MLASRQYVDQSLVDAILRLNNQTKKRTQILGAQNLFPVTVIPSLARIGLPLSY